MWHLSRYAAPTRACATTSIRCATASPQKNGVRRRVFVRALPLSRFNPPLEAINAGANDTERLHRFFVHWALKESYVKATGWGLATDFATFEFRNVFVAGVALEANRRIQVCFANRPRPNWHFRLWLLGDVHVMAVATGPPEEAAPTFKQTFARLAPTDVDWQQCPPPPLHCDAVTRLTVPDIIRDMPPWRDE